MPATRLFNRHFILLWQGQWVSQLGSQAFRVAMMLWLQATTGSASLVGLLMFCSALTGFLFGPVGGTLADRRSRRGILLSCDVLRGLSSLTLATFMGLRPAAETKIVALLFAVAILDGLLAVLFTPAIAAAVPDLVPRRWLHRANALRQLTSGVAVSLGLALGGLLYERVGAALLFLVNGVTYLFSAATEVLIEIPQRLPRREQSWRRAFAAYGADTLEGLRHVRSRTGMPALLATSATLNFFFMPILVLLPFYAHDALAGSGATYGYLMAAMTAGNLGGHALAGFLKLHAATRGRLMLGALPTISVCFALLGLVPRFFPALAFLFLAGVSTALYNTFLITLVQASTAGEIRGRVLALVFTLSRAISPIGMGLGGIMGDLTDRNVELIYVVCGGATCILAGAATLQPGFRAFVSGRG